VGWFEARIDELVAWSERVPRAVLILALFLGGYLVALLCSGIARRVMQRWNHGLRGMVERLSDRRGVALPREPNHAEGVGIAVVSRIVFWLVFTVFLAVGTTAAGVPVVSAWLSEFAAYLPRVLAACGVLLLGVFAGHVVRVLVLSAARSTNATHTRAIARTSQLAIVTIASVIAIDELGIAVTFVIVIGAIIVGSVLGGAALAFGLGARDAVKNMVSCHYLARAYRVGHQVRIDGIEGTIVAIEPTSVVLQTAEGRVSIPASLFAEKPSTLLSGERHP
jgi:small-conductance mechanosensitive channel